MKPVGKYSKEIVYLRIENIETPEVKTLGDILIFGALMPNSRMEYGMLCPDYELLNEDGERVHLPLLCQEAPKGLVLFHLPNIEQAETIEMVQHLCLELDTLYSHGILVYGLTTESPEYVRQWKKEFDLELCMISGCHEYEIQPGEEEVVMCYFVLDPDGKVLYVDVIKDPENEFEDIMSKIISICTTSK